MISFLAVPTHFVTRAGLSHGLSSIQSSEHRRWLLGCIFSSLSKSLFQKPLGECFHFLYCGVFSLMCFARHRMKKSFLVGAGDGSTGCSWHGRSALGLAFL